MYFFLPSGCLFSIVFSRVLSLKVNMDNLGETEKSDLPVTHEQEDEEGEGPPLKQLRLGRGPGRPRKLPELRGRKRERGSCKSGQSSR